MPRMLLMPWLSLLLVAAGCAENSLLSNGQNGTIQQQPLQEITVTRQNQELQIRANNMDEANQQLETELGQSKKKTRILQDELGMVKDELRALTTQLTRVREEKRASEQKIQTLTTSMRNQGSVSIRPNNSLLRSLPRIASQSVDVRREGDLIRVAIPCHQLFEHGTTQLRQAAYPILGEVAEELLRIYPRHIIGIEGHTDSDVLTTSQSRSNTQLSLGQVAMIHNVLLTQTRFQPNQLFLVGHGGNHPLISNGTPAGKQANRRIELVVYPDQAR